MPYPPKPLHRTLQGYAFDPSYSSRLDFYYINQVCYQIPWEENLIPGPVGEYLEVIDYDAPSNCFYEPVDLNDPYILAEQGLAPSDGNPKFHQQFVYAVGMKTIAHFEKALGRPVQWESRRTRNPDGRFSEEYIRRLRVYPHALRMRNAYYSPAKKALLFGYFQAGPSWAGTNVPDSAIFTCLSPDIIAHEMTHAIIDGMHPRYRENTNHDVLAFHEAISDIVALLQRFTFREVVENQIANSRGDLRNSRTVLGELATQFGEAQPENRGALRKAIGEFVVDEKGERKWKPYTPSPDDLQKAKKVHDRGAVLVATIFDALLNLYENQTRDIIRIASNGTGILQQGELNIDLVRRLAAEISRLAGHLLNICITALDYCPPIDITFGEYLRALITADYELSPRDEQGMRLALLEAFRRRGIKPDNVVTYSVESLKWTDAETQMHDQSLAMQLSFLESAFIDPVEEDFAKTHLFVAPDTNAYASEIPIWDVGYVREEKASANDEENHKKKEPSKPYRKKNWNPVRYLKQASDQENYRYIAFQIQRLLGARIHNLLVDPMNKQTIPEDVVRTLGLWSFKDTPLTLSYQGKPTVYDEKSKINLEVHSVFPLQRVGAEGKILNQVVIRLTQSLRLPPEWAVASGSNKFRGGSTIILDLDTLKIKYIIRKSISTEKRLQRQLDFQGNHSEENAFALHSNEVFAATHMHS